MSTRSPCHLPSLYILIRSRRASRRAPGR
jgi:hypothetical protein